MDRFFYYYHVQVTLYIEQTQQRETFVLFKASRRRGREGICRCAVDLVFLGWKISERTRPEVVLMTVATEEQLRELSRFFDHLVELVPARFYSTNEEAHQDLKYMKKDKK